MTELLDIDSIDLSIALQMRDGGPRDDRIEDYEIAMRNGDKFPPVDVFRDGKKLWLADGLHRTTTRKKIGFTDIEAEIHDGGKHEALLFAAGANTKHGLARSSRDKRAAIRAMLLDDEYRQWSNKKIAAHVAVATNSVRTLYQAMVQEAEIPARGEIVVQRKGQEYTRAAHCQIDSVPEKPKKPRAPKNQQEKDREEVIAAIDLLRTRTYPGHVAYHDLWLRDYLAEVRFARDWLDEILQAAIEDGELAA